MTREVRLQRLSWPEIDEAINAGTRTAVICAASSEQHGPHLPEATDELLGEELAIRLAERLGDALVAPVIRPGCSDHHMGFPGTVTISPELLMQILDAYLESLSRHGFERFIVFSSHGGNFPVLRQWQDRQQRAGVVVIADLVAFAGAMLQALRQFGRDDSTIPHADASETAEMLHTHPDLVHMDRAQKGFVGETQLSVLQEKGLRAVSANGVLGDPIGATPEMGEAVIDAVVTYLASSVERAASVPAAPKDQTL
jgi:creatinine amidohydrolase